MNVFPVSRYVTSDQTRLALTMDTINRLCTDPKTNDEAKRLFRLARANTAAGSGFDVGEDRVGLPAVCAYLASLKFVFLSFRPR